MLNRFVEAEVTADWDQLKAAHGNDADWSLLERSPAQRCADAIAAVCETAASAPPDAQVPVPIVNYVIDATSSATLRQGWRFQLGIARANLGGPLTVIEPSASARRHSSDRRGATG